jgi:hypothetical protein
VEIVLAIINAVAIVVLVAVTGYYAWQNRRMVDEMRSTRLLNVRPRLALGVHMPDPLVGFITVTNVGSGAALDVDVELALEAAAIGTPSERQRWREHLLLPLERADFVPPRPIGGMPALCKAFPVVTLRGAMSDALGERHPVDERIDIKAAWDARPGPDEDGGIPQHWHEDPVEKLVKQARKIAKAAADLASSVGKIRDFLGRWRP